MPFPASDDAAVIVEPGEEAFDFPATAEATQHATILRRRLPAIRLVRRDEFDAVPRPQELIERVAVVRAVTDQLRGERGREALRERGFDKGGFIWRSADHVDGDRKTMAVADRHDFAALTASSRSDGRAPFFAELKLASINVSLRSSLPRSRRSSAKHVSTLRSNPRRCHC